ncbi:hypothetical protein EV644_11659 [Kribbella orskensis]|uniref:Uncharacterized protein n=1 Tax=Kribbella orskensis TaxID=2512216 RepID=A0ABY2BCS0_9ACTN|nr:MULTISPECIES: hypothetical protein [Kribbella]TCN35266.1 hypothetical protein EV642_11759 [Kribbella sp. VKM Ac-2500]TCO16688.1 hypothetical protein EV644_11659 [Kribbella orskensis]
MVRPCDCPRGSKFTYNVLGVQEFATEADSPIAVGVTLYYDGTAVGTGRAEATQPMVFSADETTDIGYESGTTVTPDYTAATSRFTGKINWVQIDLGDDNHDHYIDPEERLRIAMARQ